MTRKLHAAELPLGSVEVQVTRLVPLAKVLPEGDVQFTSGLEQLSDTSTVKNTTASHRPVTVFA